MTLPIPSTPTSYSLSDSRWFYRYSAQNLVDGNYYKVNPRVKKFALYVDSNYIADFQVPFTGSEYYKTLNFIDFGKTYEVNNSVEIVLLECDITETNKYKTTGVSEAQFLNVNHD